MSTSFYNKRYRTPDIEVQRLNNILRKQHLERAQQERPTSELVGIPVLMESYVGFYDRFKAKIWPTSDFGNFKFPLEPDGKLLLCGADFNAGVQIDDAAFRFNEINILGTPKKVTGLDDGGILHAPIDLNFNGKGQYVRIPNNPLIRIKEFMTTPISGMDGLTWVFRLSPLYLPPEEDSYIYWKWDDNSSLWGVVIFMKPNGQIHFFCRRNGTVRGVYANTPFALVPPPAGNYSPTNYLEENYLVINATGVVPQDHIFFFQYRFSDNLMKIYSNNTDITAGNSAEIMWSPVAFPEPPTPPSTTPIKINVVGSYVSNEQTPGEVIEIARDFWNVKQLYPWKSDADYWDSRLWGNGQSRTFGNTDDCEFDPYDDFLTVAETGNPRIFINGINVCQAGTIAGTSGSPRMKILGTWRNVEVTVYAKRPTSMVDQETDIRTKTDHYCPEDHTKFGGYIFDVNWTEGKIYFKKEQSHDIGYTGRINSVDVTLNGNTWYGFKAVTYNLEDGNVKNEFWMDTTGGANGGTWVKKTEWIDNGTTTIGGSPSPKFTGSCKGSAVRTNTNVVDQYVEYKWWTVKEMVPAETTSDEEIPESPHLKTNMFDNNLSTYWKHSNRAAYAIADIGGPQRVAAVDVAWAFGNARRYGYYVYVSNELDLETFTKVTPVQQYSKLQTARQRYTFPNEQYVRYIMLLIEGYQSITPTPPGSPTIVSQWLNLPAIGAQASATDNQSGNTPKNAIDNNLNTRWAADTDSDKAVHEAHWVEIDLLKTRTLTRMGIAWYKAHQRSYRFRVHVSTDHKKWNKVWPTDNSDYGDSDIQPADKDFDHVGFDHNWNARFVRITVLRNTTNQWASIWEVKIRALEPKTPATPPAPEPTYEAAVAEYDILGFPGTTTVTPLVALYNVSNAGPNTSEYFVKLHAPMAGSEFTLVYNVTGHTWTLGEMGQGYDRTSRGEIVDEVDNAPIYNQILTRISCYAQRFGSPTGKLRAQIRHRNNESSTHITTLGEIDVATISTTLTEYVFTKTANNYRMGVDDMVIFAYNGGDKNNYIALARTRPETVPDMHMVFYSSAANWEQISDAELDGRYYTGSQVDGTSNIMAAQRIMSTQSSLNSQVITKFTFYLRRKGTCPGNVTFKLLDVSDNPVVNFGGVAASTITTSTSALTAVTIDATSFQNKAALIDYKLAIEYSGGDVSNHILVKLNDAPSANDVLAIRSSNDVWRIDSTKSLAGTIWKGGKTTVDGGGPIPPNIPPYDDYTHDAFLFCMAEVNKRTKQWTIPPDKFYFGNANRFRLYGKYLNSTERTNFSTNKMSISNIGYGKVFTALTLRQTFDDFIPPAGGVSFTTTSFSSTSFTAG